MVEIVIYASDFFQELSGKSASGMIGKIGEATVSKFFTDKGFEVIAGMSDKSHTYAEVWIRLKNDTSYPGPFDYLLQKNDKHCIIDVKSTTKAKWFDKKRFDNHIRYKKYLDMNLLMNTLE